MKVFFSSTSYPASKGDWRGRFVERMVHGLSGIDGLRLVLWCPPGEYPQNVCYGASLIEEHWLRRMAGEGGIAHLLKNQPIKGVARGLELVFRLRMAMQRAVGTDLYHLNWLQNCLSLPGDGKPVLVTALGSDMDLLKWPGMVTLLRSRLKNRRVFIAPNNSWMVAPIERFFSDLAQIQEIRFGIDDAFFKLKRQISQRPRIWLAVCRVTRAKIGPLIDWGEDIFSGDEELHLLGPNTEKMALPSWVRYHGPTNLHELREKWLPRASALVTLSSHSEGLPQIILEAMASGLPVIASPLAAHREMIAHDGNGVLVDSSDGLQGAVDRLRDSETNHLLGAAARSRVAVMCGTWSDMAARYHAAYKGLLRP